MRRFRFPLEQALRYKERRERLAEVRQMQAAAAKRQCDADIVRIARDIDANAAQLATKMGRPLEMSTWLATFLKSEQLGRELKAAHERLKQAQKALAEASANLKKAAQEAEMLRTLRAGQRQAYLEECAKTEQVQLEEQALLRWQNDDLTPDS